MKKVVTVFGSPSLAEESDIYKVCYDVGRELARAGYITMTGGYEGVMEAASRGAAEAGGEVHGVTVEMLENVGASRANRWVGKEYRYPTLDERANHMIRKTDAYVIMPGGIGTLHEFVQVWQAIRLKSLTYRPLFIYRNYWKPLIDHMRGGGFIHEYDVEMLLYFTTPQEMVDSLDAWYDEE